jgi:hypothetical protein
LFTGNVLCYVNATCLNLLQSLQDMGNSPTSTKAADMSSGPCSFANCDKKLNTTPSNCKDV